MKKLVTEFRVIMLSRHKFKVQWRVHWFLFSWWEDWKKCDTIDTWNCRSFSNIEGACKEAQKHADEACDSAIHAGEVCASRTVAAFNGRGI